MNKWIFLSIFLCGCVPEGEQTPDPKPDELYDHITPLGVMIKTNGEGLPPDNYMDKWWTDVQQCIGMSAAPPLIILVNNLDSLCAGPTDNYSGAVAGRTCPGNPPFIGLNKAWSRIHNMYWKHEMIHYVLVMNGYGFTNEWNTQHIPEEIWQCQF